jgi:hypothetical protein
LLNSLAMSVFPALKTGRLPHQDFRGLLSVHSRYGLHARRVAFTTLYTEGSDGVVTSTAASVATGRSNSCRAGLLSSWRTAPFHGAPQRLPSVSRMAWLEIRGLRTTGNGSDMARSSLGLQFEEQQYGSKSPSDRYICSRPQHPHRTDQPRLAPPRAQSESPIRRVSGRGSSAAAVSVKASMCNPSKTVSANRSDRTTSHLQ